MSVNTCKRGHIHATAEQAQKCYICKRRDKKPIKKKVAPMKRTRL